MAGSNRRLYCLQTHCLQTLASASAIKLCGTLLLNSPIKHAPLEKTGALRVQDNWALKCAMAQIIRHYCWSKANAWWIICDGITWFSPYRSQWLALYGDDFSFFFVFPGQIATLLWRTFNISRYPLSLTLKFSFNTRRCPVIKRLASSLKFLKWNNYLKNHATRYTFGWWTPGSCQKQSSILFEF